MVKTNHQWQKNAFSLAGTFTDPITPGAREGLILPSEARTHYVWLAAGAYFQITEADHWWVCSKIEFYLANTKQGEFLFSDHSRQLDISTERTIAPFELFRLSGDGGSVLPALVYQWQQGAVAVRESLTLPCFQFNLQADRVVYSVMKSFYTFPAPSAVDILTGLRVLSV